MARSRPLGYWLKLVDSLIDDQFSATLEEHGVTRRQWQVLNLLEQRAGTERELIDALGPYFASADEPPNATEHLEELVESGWITREGDYYSITERGHTSLQTLSQLVEEIRERCGANLSEQEYSTTVATLERMARNLGWEPETTSA